MLVVIIVELVIVDMEAFPAKSELTYRVENELAGFIV
jgi:hypothetical protein